MDKGSRNVKMCSIMSGQHQTFAAASIFSDKNLHLHPAVFRMLPTKLATAECSRRSRILDSLGGSALSLSGNVSGYRYKPPTGSLETESKPWIGATDSLLLENIFPRSNKKYGNIYVWNDKFCYSGGLLQQ